MISGTQEIAEKCHLHFLLHYLQNGEYQVSKLRQKVNVNLSCLRWYWEEDKELNGNNPKLSLKQKIVASLSK